MSPQDQAPIPSRVTFKSEPPNFTFLLPLRHILLHTPIITHTSLLSLLLLLFQPSCYILFDVQISYRVTRSCKKTSFKFKICCVQKSPSVFVRAWSWRCFGLALFWFPATSCKLCLSVVWESDFHVHRPTNTLKAKRAEGLFSCLASVYSSFRSRRAVFPSVVCNQRKVFWVFPCILIRFD